MTSWNTIIKSSAKGVAAILGVRLLDPIEVFYLPKENTFYPIISKSACSSIKVMLIRKFIPDFESRFPEIHQIDPSSITDNQVQRIYFYKMEHYEKWAEGKKLTLVIREPISRFYSCYIDVKKGKNIMYKYPSQLDWFFKFKRDLSLSAFLKKVCSINDVFADRHFRSQTFYLNSRVRKRVSDIKIHELDAFMEYKTVKKSDNKLAAAKLNTNSESIANDERTDLENNLRFMRRFEEDIKLYAEVSAPQKGI